MTKKYFLLLLTSLISILNGYGQINSIPKDTIVSRFIKGDMIIINNWVLVGPHDFFDSIKLPGNSFKAKALITDSAILKYGYFGNRVRIYELSIPSIDTISYGYFIDAQILKYLNPEKQVFYFIDGAPCWKYSNAINLLVNKKIIEIQNLRADQSTAIWGEKDGKNGALIINTDKKPTTVIIFK